MDLSVILNFAADFALSNPKFAGACAVAYMIGVGAKILREAIESFVLASPSKSDDLALEKAKANPIVKIAFQVLDVLFRLKKPEAK
jgi:hypothetical protein